MIWIEINTPNKKQLLELREHPENLLRFQGHIFKRTPTDIFGGIDGQGCNFSVYRQEG